MAESGTGRKRAGKVILPQRRRKGDKAIPAALRTVEVTIVRTAPGTRKRPAKASGKCKVKPFKAPTTYRQG